MKPTITAALMLFAISAGAQIIDSTSRYYGLDSGLIAAMIRTLPARIVDFDATQHKGSIAGAWGGAVQLNGLGSEVSYAEINNITGWQKLATLLKEKQKKAFPVLRKQWAADLDKYFWKDNIDVGPAALRNRSLVLTGGTFASNRSVAEYQALLSGMASDLRFTKIFYKWYSGDDGQYYDIDSLADDELSKTK